MNPDRRTGVFGGTFDPIHAGHMKVAAAAVEMLDLDEVLLIPSRTPPHRANQPHASPYHRFAMTAMAAGEAPRLMASDLELFSPDVSYTSATLKKLIDTGYEWWQLFFLTGADAFAEIATWNEYPAVLDLAHFVVVSRPGAPATAMPRLLPELASRMRLLFEPTRLSAHDLRQPAILLIDAATPQISSTDIRRRLREREAIDGLVPEPVARHIARHHLYSSEHEVPAASVLR